MAGGNRAGGTLLEQYLHSLSDEERQSVWAGMAIHLVFIYTKGQKQ